GAGAGDPSNAARLSEQNFPLQRRGAYPPPRQWNGSALLHSRPIPRTSALDPTPVGQFLASGTHRNFSSFFLQKVVKRDPGLVAIVVHLLANIGNSTIQIAIV